MEKKNWLIIIDNNDVDGVDVYTFNGTYQELCKQVQLHALSCAREEGSVESIGFEYSTDSCSACVQLSGYHYDIMGMLFDNLPESKIIDNANWLSLFESEMPNELDSDLLEKLLDRPWELILEKAKRDEDWGENGFCYIEWDEAIFGSQINPRHYLIQHEESEEFYVMADLGNCFCGYVSSLENYNA